MIELRGAGPVEFALHLDRVIDIYTAAMHPPAEQITGRRHIMRSHGTYPAFQCYFAQSGDATVGFAYGFHGASGQWWHDVVQRALYDRAGREAAESWLGDAFELAEIHVHPDYQGKGIGRTLIRTLCAGRTERTGVLSTHDQPTVARHLYRSMGFTDLLTQFVFPGGYENYAIVATPLPLQP